MWWFPIGYKLEHEKTLQICIQKNQILNFLSEKIVHWGFNGQNKVHISHVHVACLYKKLCT